MPYGRHGYRQHKKYTQPVPDIEQDIKISPNFPTVSENIPLPNEYEETDRTPTGSKKESELNVLERFFGGIAVEEIILLGIIFILLVEGIEDDLLLIALVFILISGRE
jgi:hypothetical protein